MEDKIAHFTQIAWQALDAYDLVSPRVTYLQHSENITFKVDTAAEVPYLLRIHSPLTEAMGRHGKDPEAVRSEMRWLDVLHRGNLPVQRPVRNRNGQFVTRKAEGHPSP